MADEAVLFENAVPVIIANASPFRIITLDENDIWNPTWDELNSRSYNYVKLHRTTSAIDVGLPKPFSMVFGYDGSFILPALPEFKNREKALEIFNRTLGELLFGGIYYEAVSPNDLSSGILYFNGYFKSMSTGKGLNASFHSAIGMRYVGTLDLPRLYNPPSIEYKTIFKALEEGRRVLNRVPQISVPILLNGITFLVKKQWSEALSNIWTSIEQVVNQIWDQTIIKKDPTISEVSGRKEFLRDYRTWTVASEIEVLYQRGLIDIYTYQLLNMARKSRNEFIHKGFIPSREDTKAAIEGLFAIISLVISEYKDSKSLNTTLENILQFLSIDNRRKRKISDEDVIAWLPIPPIPGDKEWGDAPYEDIDEIHLRPVDEKP